jgi:uncharacterized membrane protein
MTRSLALRVVGLLALAAAVHLLALWAAPRLIMHRVLSQLSGPGLPVLPPMTDHLQRRVVMPSPDLLYALCPFDLSRRPLRVRADPASAGVTGYWSIALYASNSDNVFVLNDRAAAGRPVDLLLLAPGTTVPASGSGDAAPAAGSGARRVGMPTARGLLLMRVLVDGTAAGTAAAEAARRTLRCEPA